MVCPITQGDDNEEVNEEGGKGGKGGAPAPCDASDQPNFPVAPGQEAMDPKIKCFGVLAQSKVVCSLLISHLAQFILEQLAFLMFCLSQSNEIHHLL